LRTAAVGPRAQQEAFVADEVTITLEPLRLQAMANIALLKASQSSDDAKRREFLRVLGTLVDDLTKICGAGMGIAVRFKSSPDKKA
jgi:hypothetical protein